jgi:hypothetical protein
MLNPQLNVASNNRNSSSSSSSSSDLLVSVDSRSQSQDMMWQVLNSRLWQLEETEAARAPFVKSMDAWMSGERV